MLEEKMTDILLAKPTLSEGFIDASVGEPYIIRDQLDNLFTLNDCVSNYSLDIFEYQKPNGYLPLVKELEDKHQAPVVVCSGAKQAISALLYSIKKSGRNKIGLRIPYWALFKPLIKMHGLTQVESIDDSDSYLLVHPSNPDGYCFDNHTIEYYSHLCQEQKKPFIHDPVYYNHVY